ncbi:MAG: DUF4097 family beta strand repeat-containing protein [Clostridium sp.]
MSKKFITRKIKLFLMIMLVLTVFFYTSGYILLTQSGYNLANYIDKSKSISDFLYLHFNNAFSELINPYSSCNYDIDNNISEINFNITSQNIQLINSNSDILNVKIKGLFTSDVRLNYTDNGNKIVFSSNVDIPDFTNIIIEIPEFISSRIRLKITTNSGNIDINDFSCNSISLSSANGDITLENSKFNYIYSSSSCGDINLDSVISAKETNLANTSGSINFNGSVENLTANTSTGNMYLTFRDNLKDIFLNSVSGDINLLLPSDLGYEVNFNTLSGTLNADKDDLFNKDKSAKINVRTNNSDLNVQRN